MPSRVHKNLVQVVPQPPKANNSVHPNEFCYQIVMFEDLPVLDLSQTVLRCLFKVSPETNDKLSKLINRSIPLIYGTYFMGCICTSICLLSKDILMQSCLAVASVVLSIPFMMMYLMINAQMAILVTKQYDFWFLLITVMVLLIVMAKVVMPNAWRIFACANIWIGLVYTLFFDGTPHFRVAHVRFMILLTPCLTVDVFAIMGRFVEPANYDNSGANGRVNLQDTDLVLNCTVIIAIFYGFRLFMNHQWLNPTPGLVYSIQCQTFRPSHGMVQVPATVASRVTVTRIVRLSRRPNAMLSNQHSSMIQPITSSPMLEGFVNARKTYFNTNAALTPLPKWLLLVLHGCGICGLVLTCVSFLIGISGRNVGSAAMIAWIGLGCTMVFCCSGFVYNQRDLAVLIISEIDVWFASLQFSFATSCFMDMLCWDSRILFCISFYVWYHWVICTDALPPICKEILGFHQRLMLLVISVIMVYLLALAVWLVFRHEVTDAPLTCVNKSALDSTSGSLPSFTANGPWVLSTPALVNRVMMQYTSHGGRFRFQMETFSVFTSKLVTCLLWTGRLLWREMYRPRGAFRMLRSRVQYWVPVSWDR